jgi:membrane protease YdiL (CAAX protease family)
VLSRRGLTVKALQSSGLGGVTIWLIPTAAFAAIHLPYFGVAGMTYIFACSCVVTAIRVWRKSLTPDLILHVCNNIIAYLVIPLLRIS